MAKPDLGLGRRYVTDGRDTRFPMQAALPPEVRGTRRYWWANGWWGDQGSRPECVGYAWAHWLEDGPVTHDGTAPIVNPSVLYKKAQKVDEWPGENYAGTSVRAGAKILQEMGLIQEYRWAWDMDPMVEALLSVGPVVVGVNWYGSMFDPNYKGIIKVSGSVAGGHALIVNGVNTERELFRLKNSWGREWGENGYAWISFSDMRRLIREDGEVCLAMEKATRQG